MARAWNWQKWGSVTDPIHKSDLNGIVGKFGCLAQFKKKKIELATEGARKYEAANGKLCCGNAVHTVIHRVCKSKPAMDALKMGEVISRASLEKAFREEFENERKGREVKWWGAKEDKWTSDCIDMLEGLMGDITNHVEEVVMAECGFVYELNNIWLTGAIDLLYRPKGGHGLAMADWKTGAQKPHQIDLDHGWEAGIYGNAVKSAWFVPFDSVEETEGVPHRIAMERACVELGKAQDELNKIRAQYGEESNEFTVRAEKNLSEIVSIYGARRFDDYPTRIRHVHLRDYVPYKRKSAPMMLRPEELEWAGLTEPAKYPREKGDQRGPAWYKVNRSESDTPRLSHLLKAVVSWVRFGRFPAAPGEMCTRCKFKSECLLEGYKPIGEDLRQVEMLMKKTADFDSLEDDD